LPKLKPTYKSEIGRDVDFDAMYDAQATARALQGVVRVISHQDFERFYKVVPIPASCLMTSNLLRCLLQDCDETEHLQVKTKHLPPHWYRERAQQLSSRLIVLDNPFSSIDVRG
jgi:hypothetical protein